MVARGDDKEESTYHIWSSGSDDDGMRNPNHGAMYEILEEDEEENVVSDETGEEEEITRRYFVSTDSTKLRMTVMVHDLLNSFKIPSSSYIDILSEFDNTCLD